MSRLISSVPSTSNFDFLYGKFSLSKWEIPYFATTVGLQEAASDLRLTTEIPGSEDIAWSVDELYQRDIDWVRVQRNIVPYLRNSEVPQFFNSITIALLPYDQNDASLADNFDGPQWEAPPLQNPDIYSRILEVGPIRFGFWDEWQSTEDMGFRSGRMAWNKNEVFGVAIDGQHRLAAIKELAEGGGGPIADSRVPVIFLLFDERVGYKYPGSHANVEVLRRLFIDLNKHAQTVKRGRQILLDDRDPHAVCVRRIIDDRLRASADSLALSPPRLPLAFVDWHSEQAKFDDGPYLTTVLGLDWSVIECLGTRPISDWTDYSAVGRQLGRLETRLNVDLGAARDRLAELENISMAPFVYLDEDLELIADAFVHSWGRSLIRLLTKFAPYEALTSTRIQSGSLSLRFQQWFQLYQAKTKEGANPGRAAAEYGRFMSRVGLDKDPMGESDFVGPLEEVEDLKDGSLAFKVVFQKALIAGYLEFAKFSASHVEELGYDEDEYDLDEVDFDVDMDLEVEEVGESNEVDEGIADSEMDAGASSDARVSEYLAAMNNLVQKLPHLLDVEGSYDRGDRDDAFWLGSLLKPDGGIDFTNSAAGRSKDLLFIIASMHLYVDRGQTEAEPEFDDFWSECQDPGAVTVCRAVGRAIKRLTKDESSLAGRILKSRDSQFEEDAAREELELRLRYVWEGLGL